MYGTAGPSSAFTRARTSRCSGAAPLLAARTERSACGEGRWSSSARIMAGTPTRTVMRWRSTLAREGGGVEAPHDVRLRAGAQRGEVRARGGAGVEEGDGDEDAGLGWRGGFSGG